MTTSQHRPVEPVDLPESVRTYLTAHATRDARAAADAFTPGAVVRDDGRTYRGAAEVAEFLRAAGGPFTYTTELVEVTHAGTSRWVVRQRLEGDFPGGVVELDYRFVLSGGLISELVISP